MGVVYKLTEVVIQFVLDQKKNNPKLSCRKLAELASGVFQTEISKSSINTLLKNNALSSAVGRPISGLLSKKDKFSIPPERKKQLFEPLSNDLKEKPQEAINQETSTSDPVLVNQAPPILPKEEGEELAQERLSLRADPLEENVSFPKQIIRKETDSSQYEKFIQMVSLIREEEFLHRGPPQERMGAVFLKAMLEYFGFTQMMAQILTTYVFKGARENLSGLCEALALLRFLQIKNEQEMFSAKNDIVWMLTDERIKKEACELWRELSTEVISFELNVVLSNEIQQRLSMAQSFRIVLDDNTDFLLGTDMHLLGNGQDGNGQVPLYRALEMLSKSIISNKEKIVIGCLSLSDKSEEHLLRFLGALNVSGRPMIKRVDVLDHGHNVLAQFSAIPKIKRAFIMGLSPKHPISAMVTKSLKWAGIVPFYLKELNLICYYADIQTDYFKGINHLEESVRVITVWLDKEGPVLVVLLTNSNEEKSEEILREYLLSQSWILSADDDSYNSNRINEVNNTNLFDNKMSVLSVFEVLNHLALNYCRQELFRINDSTSTTDLNSIIYNVKGHISIEGLIQKNIIYRDQKSFIKENVISKMNGLNVIDQNKKRQIFIMIDKE